MRARVADFQAAVLGSPQAGTAELGLFDTSGWLARELVARPLDYRACQRLEALGVPGRFVAELNARCLIGAGRVQISPNGERWEIGGSEPRLLLGVTDGGALADVLAVSTSAPDQVSVRTGAGWGLGDDVIRQAEADAHGREQRVTVKLVADPLEWLRLSGCAIWVRDWAAALPPLRGLGERVTLECDAGAGARLRALLEFGGLPKVKERAPRGVSVAAKAEREAA